MKPFLPRKAFTLAGAALLCSFLAACLLMPGKFASTLDVGKDGRFTFAYTGEIHILPFAKPSPSPAKFEASACRNEETFEERKCSSAELAQQKQDWEAEQRNRAEKDRTDAQAARAMLGGIDPDDPRAAEELAARLRKQAGWRRVVYKGKGLYDVDFHLSGTLDRDFAFPTIERFPMANAFVQIAVHQDGTVRIDAPGFAPASGMPMSSLMVGAMADPVSKDGAPMPMADGTFTVRTDAAVLANNTDEGPLEDAAGVRLHWPVNVRTPAAPTTLLRLAR